MELKEEWILDLKLSVQQKHNARHNNLKISCFLWPNFYPNFLNRLCYRRCRFKNRTHGNFTPSGTFGLFWSQEAWQVQFPLCFDASLFPLQHHYFGIRHQHRPFKSNIFPSSLQLSYACLCRGNISSFVCQFTVVVVVVWTAAPVGIRCVYVSGFLITINFL